MKRFFSLIRRCAGKKPVKTGCACQPRNFKQSSATILAFQPARRWPPDALDRLAEDLAAAHSAQTNANIIKFPR